MSVNAITPQQNIQVPQQTQCECKTCAPCNVPVQTLQADTVSIQSNKENKPNFLQKAKSACKKTGNFISDNKTIIRSSIKGVGQGLLNACTILGASQIIDKVTKSKTTKLATTLAVIGGVGVVAAQIVKDNKRMKEQAKLMKNA